MTTRFHQLSIVFALGAALALPALPEDLFVAGTDADALENGEAATFETAIDAIQARNSKNNDQAETGTTIATALLNNENK